MKIEVNVPSGMDLDHTYQAIMDAVYNADNVSKQEVLLVSSMLNELASKKSSMPKGFRDWAETHYEMAVTINELSDSDMIPPKLEKILASEGLGGLYDLSIDLTNEFENTYQNRVWDGDWIDTLIEFINNKLK